MKKLLLIGLILTLPLFADFKRTSRLIDIPTARILPHFGYRVGADLTIQLGPGEYDQIVEENLHMSLGLGDFVELYFDVNTIIENWTVTSAPTRYPKCGKILAVGMSINLDVRLKSANRGRVKMSAINNSFFIYSSPINTYTQIDKLI